MRTSKFAGSHKTWSPKDGQRGADGAKADNSQAVLESGLKGANAPVPRDPAVGTTDYEVSKAVQPGGRKNNPVRNQY